MADEKKTFNIFVTGGAESAGLATIKALLRNGHKVIASAVTADDALAIRRAGALPVYPDLTREGEILSVLRMADVDVVVHAVPQIFGGIPQADFDYSAQTQWLVDATNTLVQAAGKNEVDKIVSVSFGYLQDADGAEYSAMKSAEAAVLDGGIDGYVVRTGYIYGGNTTGTKAIADALQNTQAIHKGTHTASWIHEDDLAEAIVALVEAESDGDTLAEIVNVADDHPQSPNDFATHLGAILGFQTVNFASSGFMTRLRGTTLRDKLLKREIVLDTSAFKEKYGWAPQHADTASGLDSTTLQWRMSESIDYSEFYDYEDKATEAIEALKSGASLELPEETEEEKPEPAKAEAKPAEAAKPASPPPADAGPAPWNEDEAKKEERRRKALERKKKRAERGG